ncbi:MAG: helix-turn-helix domain-containing protein [Aquabacterium sp.]|nr:helix-turn-helix domain-containing protein [Aquabacterium sp.]
MRQVHARSVSLPVYALYGEPGLPPLVDQLHCETIAQRSRLHGWEIQAHRHEHLFQILYLDRGRMQVQLDSGDNHRRPTLELDGPAAVSVPALVPHGFRFDDQVQGTVITVFEPHLDRLLGAVTDLRDHLRTARVHQWADDDPAHRPLGVLIGLLCAEYHAAQTWRAAALDAALLAVLVHLARPHRQAAIAAVPRRRRAEHHVRRLRVLVEERFRQQPSLAALARELGISSTHLNRAAQEVLGHSALGVLHQRLLLEAQRELTYTSLSVKQVAWSLGFADAAYFTRFFQRLAGRTPTQWRAAPPDGAGRGPAEVVG